MMVARAVLSDPQHPYTQLLLASVATTGPKWEEAEIALQDMDKNEFVAEGCRFRHHCPLAEQICADMRPGATVLADGRRNLGKRGGLLHCPQHAHGHATRR